jgi:hypothetical protein
LRSLVGEAISGVTNKVVVTYVFSRESGLGSVTQIISRNSKQDIDDGVIRGAPINVEIVNKVTKIVVGLGMYIDCFPDALKSGVPADLAHPSQFQHKNMFTVGIADKVRVAGSGTHDSPIPHMRKGYLKTLRAERFTKKRFQTIFVASTFVKGRAATVLSPEQVDAQAVQPAQ